MEVDGMVFGLFVDALLFMSFFQSGLEAQDKRQKQHCKCNCKLQSVINENRRIFS